MPYKDPEVLREYQKVWMRRRRNKFRKGAVCAVPGCGKTKHLELDHIDPKKKLSHRIWSWSEKRIRKEMKKCQWLCPKHHRVKTSSEQRRPITHGTKTGYTRGCRCAPCRKDAVDKKREWRKRFKKKS